QKPRSDPAAAAAVLRRPRIPQRQGGRGRRARADGVAVGVAGARLCPMPAARRRCLAGIRATAGRDRTGDAAGAATAHHPPPALSRCSKRRTLGSIPVADGTLDIPPDGALRQIAPAAWPEPEYSLVPTEMMAMPEERLGSIVAGTAAVIGAVYRAAVRDGQLG